MKISIHHNTHFITFKRENIPRIYRKNHDLYRKNHDLITYQNNNPTKLDNHDIYLDRHQHLWNILYNTNI